MPDGTHGLSEREKTFIRENPKTAGVMLATMGIMFITGVVAVFGAAIYALFFM